MAWLQRRPKYRRISALKARPLPRKASKPLSPPGKRAGCYFLTALFLVGAVVILNFPTSGPRIKPRDVARRDHRARVTFKVLDRDATRRAREAAEAKALRVYRESADTLQRVPHDLNLFLRSLARRYYDPLPIARDKWGIGEEQIHVLRAEMDEKWIASIVEPVEAALKKSAGFGIMVGTDRQEELNSDRYEILVRSETDGEETRRSATLALDYPAGLREFLAEEMQGILDGKSEAFRKAFAGMVAHAAKPTLRIDKEATESALRFARSAVEDRYRVIDRDSVILAAGERATPQIIEELAEEELALKSAGESARNVVAERKTMQRKAIAAVGITALFLTGFILLAIGATAAAPGILMSNTRLTGMYVVILVTLLCARFFEEIGLSLQWTPLILSSMVMAVMAGPAVALGGAAFLAVLSGFITTGGITVSIPLLVAGCVAIIEVQRLRRRTQTFEAGVVAGVVQMVMVWAVWAVHRLPLPEVALGMDWPVQDSIAAMAGGVIAGATLTAALPYIERFFDVATDLRLREWIDQNQALLRKLALEAPGTYHHSTVVSNMAEVAAEEIGANPLLAGAGGYLHDVGKLCRPEYFIENMNGQPSRHERLSPMLSSLILTAHTKDGLELAAQYGVPTPIRRIILEHHGTCVTEYFYTKALTESESTGETVNELSFRYRGPKPRTPESAIVMLADSAESAARSMDNASPASIEKLVHSIVERRLRDGQLDECGMDMTDIRIVERSFVRSLTAMSHPRIRYPASA